MKKWLTIVLFLCSIGSYGQQLNLQIKPYLGLHTGVFNEKGDSLIRDNIFGYQGGFSFRVSKGKAFLEPGFVFLRSYFEIPDTVAAVFNELGIEDPRVKYNSFEFPVVMGYKFIETPLFKWYVAGGFAMNVSIKSSILDGKEEVIRLKAKEYGFANPRFSMRLGSGVDIAFFTIDVYYSLGLNSATTSIARTQSHQFELNFGVLF
ncbi:MAG: hypothetical protein KDD32_03505 [Bacteroidetes bacterium]|nr:hypothetical protein [Bacteroidota bacterium]